MNHDAVAISGRDLPPNALQLVNITLITCVSGAAFHSPTCTALMQTPSRTGWLFVIGVLMLLIALCFQMVTLASQQYRAVLVIALVLTALADGCFIQAFRRGGLAARCFSVLLLLPTLFVVADFMRRAPYSFR